MTRHISSAMQDHLEQSTTTLTILYKIVLTNGTIYRFTALDREIEFEEETYLPLSLGDLSAIEYNKDGIPANIQLEAVFESSGIREEDIYKGLWDHARYYISLVNHRDTSMGQVKLLTGFTGEVSSEYRQKAKMDFKSLGSLLKQNRGRYYTKQCDVAELGGDRCGVNVSSFTVTGAVTGVTDRNTCTDSSRTEEDGYFKYGVLTWTSGENNSLKIEVKEFSGGQFELWEPMPYAIQIGDSYSVYAGCDREFDTCRDKFGNAINFQGHPDIPGRDEGIRYAG